MRKWGERHRGERRRGVVHDAMGGGIGKRKIFVSSRTFTSDAWSFGKMHCSAFFRYGVAASSIWLFGGTLPSEGETVAGRPTRLIQKWQNSSISWTGAKSSGLDEFIVWGYSGSTCAVAVSTDGGKNWSASVLNGIGKFANIASGWTSDNENGDNWRHLFYATLDNDGTRYATSSDGLHWTLHTLSSNPSRIEEVSDGDIYNVLFRSVLVSNNGSLPWVTEYSYDGGQTWSRTNYAVGDGDFITSVCYAGGLGLRAFDDTFFFAVTNLGRLYRSDDFGENFSYTGYSFGFSARPSSWAIFYYNGRPEIYACGGTKFIKSSGGMSSWSYSDEYFDAVVSCWESDDSMMRLYRENGNVYESTDGTTFQAVLDENGSPLNYSGHVGMTSDGYNLIVALGDGRILRGEPGLDPATKSQIESQIAKINKKIKRLTRRLHAAKTSQQRSKIRRHIKKLKKQRAVLLAQIR